MYKYKYIHVHVHVPVHFIYPYIHNSESNVNPTEVVQEYHEYNLKNDSHLVLAKGKDRISKTEFSKLAPHHLPI